MISNTYIQQPYKTQPMKSNIFKVICIFLQDTLNNVKGFKIAKSDRKFKFEGAWGKLQAKHC